MILYARVDFRSYCFQRHAWIVQAAKFGSPSPSLCSLKEGYMRVTWIVGLALCFAFIIQAKDSNLQASLPGAPIMSDHSGNDACLGPGPRPDPHGALNLDKEPLQPCRSRHDTGFFRDGYCRTGPQDYGVHAVCTEVTAEFLAYTRARGNDLVTPRGGFPGLRPGDAWCLCASRWREAIEAGIVLPARVEATEDSALLWATREEYSQGRPAPDSSNGQIQ